MKVFLNRLSHTMSKGFTVIELLVVVLIMGVLLGIVGFQMKTWLGKARVEGEIQQMYADLTNARIRATNRNRSHFVVMSLNQYQIWEDTNPAPDGNGTLETAGGDTLVQQTSLRDSLLSAATYPLFTCGSKGFMSNLSTIQIQNDYGAMYDCIEISQTRIRLGRWQGGVCS